MCLSVHACPCARTCVSCIRVVRSIRDQRGSKKGEREKKETRKYKNIDIRATIFATITIIVLKVEHMEAFGRGW